MNSFDLSSILSKYNLDTFAVIRNPDFSDLQESFTKKIQSNNITEFETSDFTEKSSIIGFDNNNISIISIAFPYNDFSEFNNTEYNISKYAIRRDYHKIVSSYLENIVSELKVFFPNNNFKTFTDSNPLFEKAIAKKSGVGIFGKNGLIYTKKYGSYIFLGEIVTDVPLKEYQSELPVSLCSSCSNCINACPNQALTEEGLFVKKCISYLTQTKTDFPSHLIDNNLWGCDICQDVCPMNQNLTPSPISDFFYLENIGQTLETLLLMSNKELKEHFGKIPIAWNGSFSIKRNILYIMQNSNNPKYISSIKKFISICNNEKLTLIAKDVLKFLHNIPIKQ